MQEYEHRFAIWMDNLQYVIEYNAAHTSHWVSGELGGVGLWLPGCGEPVGLGNSMGVMVGFSWCSIQQAHYCRAHTY